MSDAPILKLFPSRLLHAPWWVLALVTGVPFGVAMGLFLGFDQGSALGGLLTGLFAGLLFGLAMGPFLARQNRRTREQIATVSGGQEREALRAANKGPVPTDPVVREAALRLATDQLAQLIRRRVLFLACYGLFIALEAWAAITISPWFWFAVALFVGFAILVPVGIRRLERRIAVLRDADRQDDAPVK